MKIGGLENCNNEEVGKKQVKTAKEKIQSEELTAAAAYIQVSEKYRSRINQETDKDKILELALFCITEMTGDFNFFECNMKRLELDTTENQIKGA